VWAVFICLADGRFEPFSCGKWFVEAAPMPR
jgi:hypothetical protein